MSVCHTPRTRVGPTGIRYAAGKKGPARVAEPVGIGMNYAMLQWSQEKPIGGKGQRPRRLTDRFQGFQRMESLQVAQVRKEIGVPQGIRFFFEVHLEDIRYANVQR